MLCLSRNLDDKALKALNELVKAEDVDVNISISNTCYYPLLLLCRQNHGVNLYDCLQTLLKRKDLDLKVKTNFGLNAFNLLCRRYDHHKLISCLQLLIDRGIELDVTDKKRRNALTLLPRYYTKYNLHYLLQLVIQSGLDINSRDANGSNALMLTCTHYKHAYIIHAVKLLLKFEIDVNTTDENGRDALSLLCGNYEGLNLKELVTLIVNQLDEKVKPQSGYNALLMLSLKQQCHEDLMEIVRFLVEKAIDFDADKRSVVHYLRSAIDVVKSYGVAQVAQFLDHYITENLSSSLF